MSMPEPPAAYLEQLTEWAELVLALDRPEPLPAAPAAPVEYWQQITAWLEDTGAPAILARDPAYVAGYITGNTARDRFTERRSQ